MFSCSILLILNFRCCLGLQDVLTPTFFPITYQLSLTACCVNLLHVESSAPVGVVQNWSQLQLLEVKNCIRYEIWGLKIASEEISASKINKIFLGENTPRPPQILHADIHLGHTILNSLLWSCLAILQIHSDTFVDLDKVQWVAVLTFVLVDLNWNPFCTEFQLCLMKFVLCMVSIVNQL